MRALQLSVLCLSGTAITAAATCKSVPTNDCWPSEADWASLNDTISGRLIEAVPPASVCYPALPDYDAAACELVLANWTTPEYHSLNPISIHDPAWANNSCNPIYENGTSVSGDVNAGAKGCSLGFYPEYIVNATNGADVQAVFAFADTWNLRTTIKNTGHGSKIWTHNMKNLEFHADWKPTNANGTIVARSAVTVGAGVQDGELFDFAGEHNVIAAGGTNLDVGVLGWSNGGGHGLMTGAYGMGADNILEATIATPDGQVLTVNEYQNMDLFWAIRGGGGGTFGVVINQTMSVYPSVGIVVMGVNIAANANASASSYWSVIAEWLSLMPGMKEKGVHGYYSISGPPSTTTLTLGGSLAMFNATIDEISNITAPLQELLAEAEAAGAITYTTVPYEFANLTALNSILRSTGHAGLTGATASRLVTRNAVQNVTRLAQVLEDVGPTASAPADGRPNYSMSGTMTASWTPVDNALNPAWRETVVHLITSLSWDDSYPQEVKTDMANDITYDKLSKLKQLDPDSGAYLNEANAIEPGWQWDFFGDHYDRLK
ncbi:hypothetical protein E8E14_000864 [Neopestalotiopsis sp. 37M]|nr:hypothetical protein E8E14_000864 [Neopestalotiopsis sp. 37M]